MTELLLLVDWYRFVFYLRWIGWRVVSSWFFYPAPAADVIIYIKWREQIIAGIFVRAKKQGTWNIYLLFFCFFFVTGHLLLLLSSTRIGAGSREESPHCYSPSTFTYLYYYPVHSSFLPSGPFFSFLPLVLRTNKTKTKRETTIKRRGTLLDAVRPTKTSISKNRDEHLRSTP